MGRRLSNIALALALVAGLCLMAYPGVSDWWNSAHQSAAVEGYGAASGALDSAEAEELLADARAYNARLAEEGNLWTLTTRQREEYDRQLRVEGTDVMCSVEIPTIRATLPVYRGTDEDVLQVAVGHIEGSSLPVGGRSTHCVLSGHRGLPSARLFTDLDRLVVGDVFMLHTLGRTLAYEVDQILIVEPDDLSALEIVEGEDLCTLVTCTPYGVNSHRLLVRGHRTDYAPDAAVAADAVRVEPLLVAFCLAAPVLAVAFAAAMATGGRRRAEAAGGQTTAGGCARENEREG